MIALCTPSGRGYCFAFQLSSASKSAALSQGTSSNGYHSLETDRWRLNKRAAGSASSSTRAWSCTESTTRLPMCCPLLFDARVSRTPNLAGF